MADSISQQEVFEFAKAPDPPAAEEVAPETPPPVEVEIAPPPEVPIPTAPAEEAVPSWRLREEAEARRAAEDRARAMETRLQEVAAHLQQQNKPKADDFFSDPNQATAALVQQYIKPLAEEYRQGMMAMGKSVASFAHGADKVDEAEQAFLKARADQTLDVMDYERVVQAPNRYDAVVQWHKRQNVLASVGDDPAAWFEKQLEARMADPKFQASLLERVRGGAVGAKPVVKLPPSLSRTTAAAGNGKESDIGDLSDSSLFAHAMKR